MNSRKFLSLLLLLVILLITVVKAEEKEIRTHRRYKSTTTSIVKSASTSISRSTSSAKNIKSVEEDEEDEEDEGDNGDDEEKENDKKDEGKKDEKEPKDEKETEEPKEPKVTTTTEKTTTTTKTTATKTTTTTVSKTTTTTTVSKVSTTTKTHVSTVNVPTTTTTVLQVATYGAQAPQDIPVSNAIAPEPVMNPIAPSNNENSLGSNRSATVSADNTASAKEETGSNNKAVKISVISIVAVGAVVGVATIGVHAYNRKSSDDREINMAEIEAQPINYDFGKSNNELSHMPPEECNPYNVMNENNRLYMNNNPYEYKPNFDNFETTPFDNVENAPNDQFRESIFSNNENNTQPVGPEVYNFNEKQQLPYVQGVQGLPVENGFIEKPVANQIEVENFDMQNNQMPTLVPVEPEIIITKPDEEQANAQDGYKQIIPTVAKMEIIETPDFNQMTTSMIEDHINNMDLENLASLNSQPQTQNQQEQEAGYKEIVPDIQEAVIENFDIEDDQEQEFSAVDNITNTYRAALRATYCSTTDENRFSYRTVDSDHSLLHTMREEANW